MNKTMVISQQNKYFCLGGGISTNSQTLPTQMNLVRSFLEVIQSKECLKVNNKTQKCIKLHYSWAVNLHSESKTKKLSRISMYVKV